MRFLLSKISSFFYASKVDSKRRGWIDYARGVVIIYVVYRHTMSGLIHMGYPIKNAIFLVQEASMPIFFVVSGIFIHSSLVKRGFLRFVRFKFDGLLYPYLVWVTIHLTIQIIFSDLINSDKTAIFYAYILVLPRSLDQFWYLYTLFMLMIMFAAVNTYILKFRALPNALLGVALYALSYFIPTNWFAVNDCLFYYFFVTFGFLISEWLLPHNSRFFTDWRVPTILVPLFALLFYIWNSTYPGITELRDTGYMGYVLFVPLTILTAFLIFLITNKLDRWGVLDILRFIGSRSLYIYIMHLIFTGATRVLLAGYFDLPVAVMFAIILSAGVLLPMVVYELLIRMKLTFLFEPPRISKKEIISDDRP